jgi:hypothetical protein
LSPRFFSSIIVGRGWSVTKPPPLYVGCHERIFVFLFADGGRLAMTWKHDQVFVELVQLFAYGSGELVIVAALEIGAPDAAIKKVYPR